MRGASILVLAIVIGLAIPTRGAENAVRYYEKDDVTYRETRVAVRRPVSETRIEQREQTVYRPRYSTQLRETTETVYAPVTQYIWQARWHGWWNPFQQPYVAYHLVPYTYWQTRQQTTRVPVTTRDLIPEKRTVRVPVTTLRFVEKEEVSRVAVAPRPRTSAPANRVVETPRDGPIGGIARLEGDPPRHGTGSTARR